MKEVGFIGLGAMGLPMAVRLVAAGFSVRGFDLKAAALDALAQARGSRAESAAEAARDADALVLMVVNAGQARAVLFDAGALAALKSSAVVILMATCAPADAAALARDVIATGRRFVDAPVSGGVKGATGGTLTIMAAAAKPVFEATKPLLQVLGDKLFHVGEEPGQGAMVKTVNQLLAGVHIAAAAEAIALARGLGLDPAVVIEALSQGAAGSFMFADRGPRMLRAYTGGAEVKSRIDIFVKDMGIVTTVGRTSHVPLPLAAAAQQLYLIAEAAGLGAHDDSSVVTVLSPNTEKVTVP